MSNTKLTAVLVLVAAALAGVVAVFYLGPRDTTRRSSVDDAPAVVQLLKDPQPVAPVAFTDLDGRAYNLGDLKGKVVLVNFWATWCPPCLAEIPDLIDLQEKYRDQILVVGVSEDEEPVEVVRKFAAERGVNYPIVMVTPELRDAFPLVVALPTTFVLDRDGRLAKKHVGQLRHAETEVIARALSGLSVDSTIEYVEDPGRLSPSEASQITTVPGVDMTQVSEERRASLIQALNTEKCTCGCDLSVAKCRVDDPTCTVSLPIAQTILSKFVSP
jgi:thiol-disulfide isomerase/thioredoxin